MSNNTKSRGRVVRERFGAFLLGLALLTSLTGAYTQYTNRQYNECQSELNKKFADAVRDRATITAEDNRNLRNLLITLTSEPDAKKRGVAVEQFIARSAQLEARRQDSPLPEASCEL